MRRYYGPTLQHVSYTQGSAGMSALATVEYRAPLPHDREHHTAHSCTA